MVGCTKVPTHGRRSANVAVHQRRFIFSDLVPATPIASTLPSGSARQVLFDGCRANLPSMFSVSLASATPAGYP
jgi:hypothetical protein